MNFWLSIILLSLCPAKGFNQQVTSSNQKPALQKKPGSIKKNTQRKRSKSSAGEKELKKILKNYHLKPIQIKIKQEVFLAIIKTNLKSEGFLSLQANKFKLELKGRPSSLSLFDGNFLWHQADRGEKVVFKLKNPPKFQVLTNFFNRTDFFKYWAIKKFLRKKPYYFFQLQPKNHTGALNEVFIKADTYILELRLTWKDLNNWQKYTLSKPVEKSFPKSFFQFTSKDFQIITKI